MWRCPTLPLEERIPALNDVHDELKGFLDAPRIHLMPSMRLDQALVSRGLVESRTKAQRRIDAGEVSVDGVTQTKHALPVGEESTIELHGGDDYVGRGALKLLGALDHWGISVEGASVIDLGASTGGFTQVLLERGAQRVVALDVGHGQLHPSLVADERVTLCEGINVRYLDPQWWSALGVEAYRLGRGGFELHLSHPRFCAGYRRPRR